MSAEPISPKWLAGLGSDEGPIVESVRDWRDGLIQNQRGIKACLQNALVALERAPEWKGVLHFDESALQVVAKAPPPWDSRPVPFPWRDDDDVRTAAWMQQQGIMVTKEVTGQAVDTVARNSGFHPVRQYLEALVWDRIPRLDDWPPLYLSADPSDYTRAVGAKWMIGAVARVFKPGCKNDTCLVLEGPQGILKSTALRTLATPWFTDEIADLGTKDAALQVRGVWIIELAELDAMGRSEASKIKAFMSRSTDRYRPPYGRYTIEVPRESVFAGTVNHEAYLKDETGGRRFWPVRCGTVKSTNLVEIAISSGQKRSCDFGEERLGGLILRSWERAPPNNKSVTTKMPSSRSFEIGLRAVRTSLLKRFFVTALKSYLAIGIKVIRTASFDALKR